MEDTKFISLKTTDKDQGEQKQMKFNVPADLPALYTDAVYLSVGKFGVQLDFAQKLGSTEQQNVVARVGMSVEHAKAFVELLKKQLTELEKQQNNS